MAFNNSVNAKQQGTQYLSTAGAWSGLDGGAATQVLTSNGAGVAPSFQAAASSGITTVNIQTFTANGTYTPTAGMKYCVIEVVGGGAGGGGVANTAAANVATAGGGGGGGYARLKASAATIGASKAVTIGAGGAGGAAGNNIGSVGGDTSVGVLCIGKGGTGGSGNPNNASVNGGAGGVAGTGDFTTPGQAGEHGSVAALGVQQMSTTYGGASFFGFGAPQEAVGVTTAGKAGQNYGGGGGGGDSYGAGGAAAGGAGAAGLVVVTEYI